MLILLLQIFPKQVKIAILTNSCSFKNDYQGNWNGKVVAVKMMNELAICEDSLIKEAIIMKLVWNTKLAKIDSHEC